VHYTDLLESVKEKTGKGISVQTLRRYGKEECAAKQQETQQEENSRRE
jgi:hypothetical protein